MKDKPKPSKELFVKVLPHHIKVEVNSNDALAFFNENCSLFFHFVDCSRGVHYCKVKESYDVNEVAAYMDSYNDD